MADIIRKTSPIPGGARKSRRPAQQAMSVVTGRSSVSVAAIKSMGSALLASACLMAVASPTLARPVEMTAGLDNRFSDNMRKSADNEQSDVETRATLGIDYQSDPGTCNAALSGNLGYGYWWDNSYDAKTYTDLGFDGNCRVTDRLLWRLSDELHDVTRNTRVADTPDNTTRKNVVSTGPQYTIRLGDLDQVILSAAFENTEYDQNSEPDSNRVIGSAAWNHLFDPTLTGGLSVSTNRASLDTGEDIDRNSASVTFSKAWPATRVDGSLGVSELKSTCGTTSQTSQAFIGNLSLRRQINPSADFYLDLSRELTDQNSTYDVQYDGYTFNLQQTAGVKVTTVRTGVTKRYSDGSNLDTAISADRSEYLLSGDQEDRTSLTVNYNRPVATQLSLNLATRLSYLKFDQDNRDDRIVNLSAGLTYQASRQFNVIGRIGHNDRTSDEASQEYQENWISLGLQYQFL